MLQKPNILLVLPDQWRGDWIGAYKTLPIRTPNVDALAERGALFSQAWTPSPICAPARASFATLTQYDHCQVQNNSMDLDLDSDTLYKCMKKAGYRVATAGKLDLLKGRKDWGEDGQHIVDGKSSFEALGFTDGNDSAGKHDAIFSYFHSFPEPYFAFLNEEGLAEVHFKDFSAREPNHLPISTNEAQRRSGPPAPAYANTDPSPLPDYAYCDNWVGRDALALISNLTQQEDPWFLTVNFAGPHEPLDVTQSMQERWDDCEFPKPFNSNSDDQDLHQTIRRNYAAMMELIDDWLGKMVAKLDELGELENTIVVFASDHGEMLGDCNLWAKQVPHDASIRVPLVVAGPGVIVRQSHIETPATLLDLGATLLDYAGAETRPGPDGKSLRSILESTPDSAAPRRATTGLGSWRAISDGKYKLVVGFDPDQLSNDIEYGKFDPNPGSESIALYNAISDPCHQHNLLSEMPKKAASLMSELLEEINRKL